MGKGGQALSAHSHLCFAKISSSSAPLLFGFSLSVSSDHDRKRSVKTNGERSPSKNIVFGRWWSWKYSIYEKLDEDSEVCGTFAPKAIRISTFWAEMKR